MNPGSTGARRQGLCPSCRRIDSYSGGIWDCHQAVKKDDQIRIPRECCLPFKEKGCGARYVEVYSLSDVENISWGDGEGYLRRELFAPEEWNGIMDDLEKECGFRGPRITES